MLNMRTPIQKRVESSAWGRQDAVGRRFDSLRSWALIVVFAPLWPFWVIADLVRLNR